MKKSSQLVSLVVAVAMFFVFGTIALAQAPTPDIQVAGTGIVDGAVTIVQATMDSPGWVVIHADADGKPGPVIGYAPLTEGVNTDVSVDIDTDAATSILHAMLHVDEGTVGEFEFPGPDGPVKVDDNIVMARFSAAPVVAEEAMEAPAAMPATGGGVSTTLIFAVTATILATLGVSVAYSRRHA